MSRILSGSLSPQSLIVIHGLELVQRYILIQLRLYLPELHNMLNYIDFFQVFGPACSHDTLLAIEAQAEAVAKFGQVIVDELA